MPDPLPNVSNPFTLPDLKTVNPSDPPEVQFATQMYNSIVMAVWNYIDEIDKQQTQMLDLLNQISSLSKQLADCKSGMPLRMWKYTLYNPDGSVYATVLVPAGTSDDADADIEANYPGYTYTQDDGYTYMGNLNGGQYYLSDTLNHPTPPPPPPPPPNVTPDPNGNVHTVGGP